MYTFGFAIGSLDGELGWLKSPAKFASEKDAEFAAEVFAVAIRANGLFIRWKVCKA